MTGGDGGFAELAQRAAFLAPSSVAAAEPLGFVRALCTVQQHVAFADVLSGRFAEDVQFIPSEPLLRTAVEHGPEALAAEASARVQESPETVRERLIGFWENPAGDYLSRAIVQPYVRTLRARNLNPDRPHLAGHCPFCGGAAWMSVRRPGPEADAGFRHLSCSLCGLEWRFNRVSCPACLEEDPGKLPFFQSEAHLNVRIEACESCRRYLKSIDLTRDARPVPIVDDLLSIALDLWAVEEGYSRIEPGLAGI